MLNLELLPQTSSVQNLINVCISLLGELPPESKKELIEAIKEFENNITMDQRSIEDLPFELGDQEKRDILAELYLTSLKKEDF